MLKKSASVRSAVRADSCKALDSVTVLSRQIETVFSYKLQDAFERGVGDVIESQWYRLDSFLFFFFFLHSILK